MIAMGTFLLVTTIAVYLLQRRQEKQEGMTVRTYEAAGEKTDF